MNQITPVGPADRRARLLATKLAAIVRDRRRGRRLRPATFPLGAALLSSEADRPDGAWVLLDTTIDDGTGLGAALIFAVRNGAGRLDLVADAALTRRGPSRHDVPAADRRVDARRTRAASP